MQVGGVKGCQCWRSSKGHDLGGVTAKTRGGSSAATACWCLRSQRPPFLWPTQGTDPSPAVTCHIFWLRVSVPDSVRSLGVGRVFWRDSWSVWKTGIRGLGDVQGPETLMVFVCRGQEVFPRVRECWGEGLQSMGPPLISLGLAGRYSGFLYAGAAAVRAPVFRVLGKYAGGLCVGTLATLAMGVV